MNSMKEFNYKMKHSQAMPNGYYKCMSLGKRFYFMACQWLKMGAKCFWL